jgi:ribonucleoside-triphosphate reductase (thioredoxin)
MALDTELQRYIHLSRYARYVPALKRRETWEETVTRYVDFFKDKFGDEYPYAAVKDAIIDLQVMPSMRCLMTAGKALDRDNVSGYNCSFTPVNHPKCFDEILYVLMCGTGVGFSVERQYINQLPEIPDELYRTDTKLVIGDSKIGWASGFRELIALLYAGKIPTWDLGQLRPAGAVLKTFGGRSSGPEPLDDLFHFVVRKFSDARGRRLNSLEVHDIVCKIADVVVVGGVRRSALLSLGNLTDERHRNAKNGQWWIEHGQRALANNSVAYTEKPDMGIFMKEWQSLYDSRSGERGIFNRQGVRKSIENGGRRKSDFEFGTNPCGEILLRPHEFCNLSEVIVRPDDTVRSLHDKVAIAAIIGTFQSTLTDFRYLRKVWKSNCEEERLLGVSLTGLYDSPGTVEIDGFRSLKEHAIQTNQKYAEQLDINPSVAVTCIKPSGTVSQLCDTASGLHPRYSEYYIRNIRTDKKDPLTKFMIDKGYPHEDDVTKPDSTAIFSFPVKSPESSFTRTEIDALAQLKYAQAIKNHWCEHNPSLTVYVKEHEWLSVGAWVYDNFDDIQGISFLPYDTGIYRQAPYVECTEEEYAEGLRKMPVGVDFTELREVEDATTSSQELACVGGVCDI